MNGMRFWSPESDQAHVLVEVRRAARAATWPRFMRMLNPAAPEQTPNRKGLTEPGFGGGASVRIANAARRCWAVVGDRECDPRNDWLRALLRPVRSWSPAPARLEELA